MTKGKALLWPLLALPTKARIFVFRFIIEYIPSSSLRDFGPTVVGLFLYEDFLKDDIWACVET
jgi:hypothetical protein